MFGKYFPYPLKNILFVKIHIHEIKIQICGKPIESVKEQEGSSSLKYEILTQNGIS